MKNVLGYEGKSVIVTGAASGMGAAAIEILRDLGARVHALDIQAVNASGLASTHQTDLSDPASIDAAVAAVGPVDVLLNCAGLPTTAPPVKVILVNYAGLRHLTEKVAATMAPGAAIVSIASVAGMGWQLNMERLMPLMQLETHDQIKSWAENDPEVVGNQNGYGVSKEAINCYTAWRCMDFAKRGIRLSCINPGPTETAMMPSFRETMGGDYMDKFPKPLGRSATADEQAWPLIFLGSPRASYVTGTSLFVDGGFAGGLYTGAIDPAVLQPA
ncbi:MAG: coniferyl-alcohol dehydrogenase [Sphingorhabdus sp.]